MRALQGATLLSVALLAACASAPKKTAPPSSPPATAAAPAVTPPATTAPRVSPYAPAQEDPTKRGDYVAGGLFRPGVADTVPDYVPNVDAIPEPEVRDEPRSVRGNRSPYSVLGQSYTVRDSAQGYRETGTASYYGNKFHGRRTSNGEVYDMYAFTAAHRSLPLPSFARVTNLDNGRSVVVRVNDRGPFHAGRIIDLSYAAAVKLGYRERGTARVEVHGLTPGEVITQGDGAFATRRPQQAAPSVVTTPMDGLVKQLPSPAVAIAPATQPAPSTAATVTTALPRPVANDYRFDMLQNGRSMTAAEFDAWMKERRIRVATGKPGVPETASVPVAATSTTEPVVGPIPALPAPPVVTAPPPAPAMAAATAAAAVPAAGQVTLQVASFSSEDNAGQALAMLQNAGIAGARLEPATVAGRAIWRLRVGPLAASAVPELAARVAGLGFGQPQPVRP